MSVDDVVKLIDAVTKLAAALAWPVLIAVVLVRFGPALRDMSRPPDHQAGYTLLDQLRGSGDQTPFVIYAGSNAPEHKAEARKRGALGSTNKASELFEYVVRAVGGAA